MMRFVTREEEIAVLRQKVLDGMNLPIVAAMNEEYFELLRNKIKIAV